MTDEINNLGNLGKTGKNGLQDGEIDLNDKNYLGKLGKIEFNGEQPFEVRGKGPIYTHIKRETSGGTIVARKTFKVYEISLAAGNPPCYLITSPHVNLLPGSATGFLAPVFVADTEKDSRCKEMPNKLFRHILSSQGIKLEEEEDVRDRFFKAIGEAYKDTFLFNWAGPLRNPPEDLTEDDVEQLINNYLTENLTKDEDIVYALRCHIIRRTHGEGIKPDYFMSCSGHTIIYGPTTTAKSYSMKKVCRGNRYDRLTVANSLGFSSAKDTTEGALNNEHGPVAIDETDKSDDAVLAKLPGFMETGEAKIGTGRKVVNTTGTCTLLLNGNPTDTSEKDALRKMEDFAQLIEKVAGGSTPSAVGKRIPVLLYGDRFKTKTGTPFDLEQVEKERKLLEYMVDKCIPAVEGIYTSRDAEVWLNKPIDNYAIQGKEILRKANLLPSVKAFLQGHFVHSHRHMRGFALNQAILDFLLDIFKYSVRGPGVWTDSGIGGALALIPDILSSAEEHLAELQRINLESVEEMVSVEVKEGEYLVKRYENLPQEWLKALIAAAVYFSIENPNRETAVVEELGSLWNDLEESSKPVSRTYHYFSKVMEKLKKNRRTETFFSIFGLRLLQEGSTYIVAYGEGFEKFAQAMKNALFSPPSPFPQGFVKSHDGQEEGPQ